MLSLSLSIYPQILGLGVLGIGIWLLVTEYSVIFIFIYLSTDPGAGSVGYRDMAASHGVQRPGGVGARGLEPVRDRHVSNDSWGRDHRPPRLLWLLRHHEGG